MAAECRCFVFALFSRRLLGVEGSFLYSFLVEQNVLLAQHTFSIDHPKQANIMLQLNGAEKKPRSHTHQLQQAPWLMFGG